jgi:alpha-L-rhamnosidase
MFQYVAGIGTEGPGFKQLVLRPQPCKGLDWVKARYRSIHGPTASEWKTEGDRLALNVTVPANTTATVYLPTADAASVREGDLPAARAEGVQSVRAEPGVAVYRIGAGTYAFSTKRP